MTKYYVTSFYRFVALSEPEALKQTIEKFAEENTIQGLVILGREGINTTVSSRSPEILADFKLLVQQILQVADLSYKESETDTAPFRRFVVKIRPEIVTLGAPGLVPTNSQNNHLSPAEWHKVLTEENDFVLIDTRNWYETKIGSFKGALDPKIEEFAEFPAFVEKQAIPKDKKMLIFCTGGIRCEKGILELQNRGYDKVYQLDGGILNYLKEYPHQQFEGECFVFDNRVAVDQNMNASLRYKLCPHCGQPAETKITCLRCDTETHVCESCIQVPRSAIACSKHCAHMWELRPNRKGPRQVPSYLNP